MSHIKSVSSLNQVRRLIVSGFIGSGKTTLSVSASAKAGDELPLKDKVDADDVLIMQGDSEGVFGAIDCGLTPLVADFTDCLDWATYSGRAQEVLQEVAKSKTINFVVVDMGHVNRLIVEKVSPKQISDWQQVAVLGLQFYRLFNQIPGKTVIANVHVKPLQSAVESEVAKQASDAKAIGGERATFGLDLVKGVGSPWIENASMILAREVKRTKAGVDKNAPPTRTFFTHTSASARLEVKSRFASKLAPTLPGNQTLNRILIDAYGNLK